MEILNFASRQICGFSKFSVFWFYCLTIWVLLSDYFKKKLVHCFLVGEVNWKLNSNKRLLNYNYFQMDAYRCPHLLKKPLKHLTICFSVTYHGNLYTFVYIAIAKCVSPRRF